MSRILVTGMGGSGKSEICTMLNDRGFVAFDGDEVEGLARWEDDSGNPIHVDHTQFSDHIKAKWNWDEKIIDQLIDNNPSMFLCGSSSNVFKFFPLFSKILVLQLNPDKHRQNLQNRSSSYGKDPRTISWLLEEQPKFINHAIQLGAITVDANGTPEDTTDRILMLANEN